MPDPQDQGFEMLGQTFGLSGNVLVEDFQPGADSWRTQDADDPQGDARMFGRDLRSAGPWTWSLGVNREDERDALDTLSALGSAWRNTTGTYRPGDVVTLRYNVGGRVRRVYGRPRNFAPTLDVRRRAGYIAVDADFVRVDPLHYNDVENSAVVTQQPASLGGLVTPLRSPLTTLRNEVDRAGQIDVGGTAPTWARVIFKGDVINPRLRVAGWEVGFTETIALNRTVEVDPRPWVRAVKRDGALAPAGRITSKTRMHLMLLPPGRHQIVFTGQSQTGNATATVCWRDASHTL